MANEERFTLTAERITFWHYIWRRLHCASDMRSLGDNDWPETRLDTGYCLDRYTIDEGSLL